METAELIATGLLFTIQLVIKATIEIGQDELRFDSPSRGRSMCRLLYLGPDLCITAFSLYLAAIILVLRRHTVVTQQPAELQSLVQDFIVPLVTIVLLLSMSQLVWFLVPNKEFPLSKWTAVNEDQPEPSKYLYCDWPQTPRRIRVLLLVGFLLGSMALGTVSFVMRHT